MDLLILLKITCVTWSVTCSVLTIYIVRKYLKTLKKSHKDTAVEKEDFN